MLTTKTESTQHETHIESTIESIEEHVKKESTTGVPAAISSWMKALEGHDQFKAIVKDLEKLKAALADKDGAKIADLMASLGEQTTKAGEGAEGNEGTKIKHLGKVLTTAGKAIAKFM